MPETLTTWRRVTDFDPPEERHVLVWAGDAVGVRIAERIGPNRFIDHVADYPVMWWMPLPPRPPSEQP